MSAHALPAEYIIQMAGIVPESFVDGPGVRYTLFVQGCPHRCPGCHNPGTWDFLGGTSLTVSEILERITLAYKDNPHLQGVTFSGGEPFSQAKPLAALAKSIKELGLDLAIYTGYTAEDLIAVPNAFELLQYADLLVDGPFIKEKKSLTLSLRGSSNQRILYRDDLQKLLDEACQKHKTII